MIKDLKITRFTTESGYRRTGASYKDEQGNQRASQFNGYLQQHEVENEIKYVRARIEKQDQSGVYYT